MYLDEDGKIAFDPKDMYSLDIQKRTVAHLEADLVDKVRKGMFPRYLYKYRTVEECKEILRGHHLYFSKVEEFRDPF